MRQRVSPRGSVRVAGPWLIAMLLLVAPVIAWIAAGDDERRLLEPFANATGAVQSFSKTGRIDSSNPFFQSLGTNGRACVHCHQASAGWTVAPSELQNRFETTQGLDPIFRSNDGANSPLADVSTVEARRHAFSMLLSKGLIRVGLGIPDNAEFTLEAVDDPYGFASSHELSLFRRPLPSTNVAFLSTVMWDGRETFPGKTVSFDLLNQSNDATVGHSQASLPLSADQRDQIVEFETNLFTTQVYDFAAGDLRAQGGRGGPKVLSREDFFIGINDPLGLNPKKLAFNPVVFTDFAAWAKLTSPEADDEEEGQARSEARLAVARGEALFNGKRINITGVAGLNDDLNVAVIPGTCGTCHDTPNAGNHSVPAPLNIGLADASRRTPDMPLYTLKNKATRQTVQTTDPGRALVSGRWKDIGRFKGPILRGLAARAPYFHNGSARTLVDAVRFYNDRFSIGLSEAEVSDFVAFLRVQ